MAGWASLVVAVLFIGGVQLLTLGIIGEYIDRIYEEIKQRSLYIVADAVGFSSSTRETVPAPEKPENTTFHISPALVSEGQVVQPAELIKKDRRLQLLSGLLTGGGALGLAFHYLRRLRAP